MYLPGLRIWLCKPHRISRQDPDIQ